MPDLNTIATGESAGWLVTWFDIAWRGALLLGTATLLNLALRRTSASTRHLVWSVAVLALLALPLFTWTLPSWRAPLPATASTLLARLPAIASQEPAAVSTPTDAEGAHATALQFTTPRENSAAETEHAVLPSVQKSTHTQPQPRAQSHAAPTRSSTPEPKAFRPGSLTSRQQAFDAAGAAMHSDTQLNRWLAWLLPLWGVGALLVGAWFALQHGSVRYLASQAKPESDTAILWRVERARRQVGCTRRVRVLRGGMMDMPMTWGFLRPVLLLPRGMPQWPEARQRDVLLHELAHIQRRDHWTQLWAQTACALHWFNPLAWYAARRMVLEREHACDDFVLNSGARPSDYAQHLLDVARSMQAGRVGAAAAIAMAGHSTLPSRLRAILEPGRSRRNLGLSATAVAVLLGVSVVVPLAAVDLSRAPHPAHGHAAVVAARPHRVHGAPRLHAVPLETRAVAPEGPAIDASRAALAFAVGDDFEFDVVYGEEALVTPQVVVFEPSRSALDDDIVFVAPSASASVVVSPDAEATVVAGATAYVTSDGGINTAVVVGDGGSVTEVSVEKGRWNFSWREGDERLRIRARGEIQLNDDLTDVVSLSHRGFIDLEEERGRDKWRVKLSGERDGSIERQWWVDGKERPYDDEARTWLAETLPEFTRRAGFAVDQRVAALLSHDGVEAVLEEIEQVDSDHVVRLYFDELTRQADLDAEQLERVLQHAGATISSDYELAQLLVGVLEEARLRPEGALLFARATTTIGSDFEQSRALRALVQSYDLNEAAMREALTAARDIGSDFELARLLLEIAREQTLTPPMQRPFFEAVRTIGSDYEHRRVLKAFVERDDLATDLLTEILQSAARSIGSDYELTELLVTLAKRRDVQGEWVPAYVEALETIGSDYEFRRAAQALVQENTLDDASLVLVLEAAEDKLGSDFEMAQLLVQVARTHTLNEATREAYLRASDTIGSNHENRRVLSALVKSER